MYLWLRHSQQGWATSFNSCIPLYTRFMEHTATQKSCRVWTRQRSVLVILILTSTNHMLPSAYLGYLIINCFSFIFALFQSAQFWENQVSVASIRNLVSHASNLTNNRLLSSLQNNCPKHVRNNKIQADRHSLTRRNLCIIKFPRTCLRFNLSPMTDIKTTNCNLYDEAIKLHRLYNIVILN